MRSSTLQFVVAGALVAAWAWMLGRPLLTNLFRRSRRDSVGHFRYQQAVLSQPAGYEPTGGRRWSDRPRPLRAWRSQTLERRRLQTMLGFALATFFSMLLAIALRGLFVRLLVVMALCFVAYVCVAAYLGSRQLRQLEADRRRQVMAEMAGAAEHQSVEYQSAEYVAPQERSVLFPDPLPEPVEDAASSRDVDLLTGYEGFGTGEFDDDFFEPIPGLTFEPLNLDSSILQDDEDQSGRTLFGTDAEHDGGLFAGEPIDRIDAKEYVQELIGRDSGDFFIEDGSTPDQSEDEIMPGSVVQTPAAELDVWDESEVDDWDEMAPAATDGAVGSSDEEELARPTFTTAAHQQPQRPANRNKARPIYIESQLDEGDEQVKAVND